MVRNITSLSKHDLSQGQFFVFPVKSGNFHFRDRESWKGGKFAAVSGVFLLLFPFFSSVLFLTNRETKSGKNESFSSFCLLSFDFNFILSPEAASLFTSFLRLLLICGIICSANFDEDHKKTSAPPQREVPFCQTNFNYKKKVENKG